MQTSFKQLKIIFVKVEKIVEFFKKISSVQAKLTELQLQLRFPPLKSKQDVIIRWNSTDVMVSIVFTLKEAIVSTMAKLASELNTLSTHV